MLYRFDEYTLDANRRELRRGATPIPIAPQAFDLIEYLIRHRERVVGKEELLGAIWGGRIVSDAALSTRIGVARAALDDARRHRFIRTLARKGVRFVGLVHVEPDPVLHEDADALGHRPRTIVRPRRPTLLLHWSGSPLDDATCTAHAECLRDDLIVALARTRVLDVVEGEPAHYRLAGTVRRAGGALRIVVRAFDASVGVCLWADRYDVASRRRWGAHDATATAIGASATHAILRAERDRALRRDPAELDAWEACQRGLWHMAQCDAHENAVARGFLERATEIDPRYGPAHAALAWSRLLSAAIYSEMPVAEGCAIAEPMVRRAIALDGDDSDARARRALLHLLSGDIEAAATASSQVLGVDPMCADAWGVKGAALIYAGRSAPGRRAIKRYLRLRPTDPARPVRLAQVAASHYLEGDHSAAARFAAGVVREYPDHPTAYRWLAASLGQLGRRDDAAVVLDRLSRAWPSSLDMYVRQRAPQYCRIEYAPMLEGLRKAGWRD